MYAILPYVPSVKVWILYDNGGMVAARRQLRDVEYIKTYLEEELEYEQMAQ